MSDQKLREQRSKRLYNEEVKIKKRSKTLQQTHTYAPSVDKQPHRLHKVTGMNCGNSNCVMCGNPRKIFNELTIQEQRGYQLKLWDDEFDESKESVNAS